MNQEIKELLKNEIKAVNQSRVSVIIGIAMVLLDVALVISSVFSIYSLLFILPLVFIVRKQLFEYQLNQAILTFTRYIVDDEFSKELD